MKDIYEDFKNGSFLLNRKKLLSFIESKPRERYNQITGLISYEKYDEIETKLRQASKDINDEIKVLNKRNDEKISALTQFYSCESDDLYEKINVSLKKNNLKQIDENTNLTQYIDENKLSKPHKLLNKNIEELNQDYHPDRTENIPFIGFIA